MLAFVIPVKSKHLSRISWNLASEVFERCLRSVCSQTILDFRVVVVCHELPEVDLKHPHVEYIEVDFPIPTWEEPESPYRDKGRKLWTGLNYALKLQPSHIMLVDSDDCVSKYLAEFVQKNSQANGWYISKGYEYQEGSERVFHRRSKFHLKCGTSHIIRQDLLIPFANKEFEAVGWEFLWHQSLAEVMQKQGAPLAQLPFEGVIYVGNTGENHVYSTDILKSFNANLIKLLLFQARRVGKLLMSQALTPNIRNEFSLYSLQ